MAGTRNGAAPRIKTAAIALALLLAAGQVAACAHRGVGDNGAERESWMDTEVLIAGTAVITVIAAGLAAASQDD